MKRDSFGAALSLIILFLLSFIYLPLPGLDVPSGSSLDFDVENQGQGDGLFAQIRESRNLDRPFPEMPMREDNPQSREKVELGQLLYFDPILSGSNDISCAHCHHPDLGFSDNRGQSMGMGGSGIGPARTGGEIIRRGSPTIWNAAFNHRQFWDGRAADLEDQATNPIQDKTEMAQDPRELVKELRAIPEYVRMFDRAFEGSKVPGVTTIAPVPPFTVRISATFKMMSFGALHPESSPVSLTPIALGQRTFQANPVITSTASAPPTPTAIIPKPPAFGVWLSVPIIIPPGNAYCSRTT